MWSIEQKKQFLEVLTGLCEIYNHRLSTKALEFYVQVVESYPYESVMRALARHVKNARGSGQFFPKPADIIALIEGEPEERAEKAWVEFLKALERVGTWRSVRFDDPIINVVVSDLGGWIYLGEKTLKELEYLKGQFVKLYRYYLQTGEWKHREVPHLVGRAEALNAGTEYEVYELVEWKTRTVAGDNELKQALDWEKGVARVM